MSRAHLAAAFAVLTVACGGGEARVPSGPSAASAIPNPGNTPSGLGTLSLALPGHPLVSGAPDFASCLAAAGQPACVSPMRVVPQADGASPAAPSNLIATATGSSVTLVWTAPASADPVVSYVIEAGSFPGAANLANFSTGSPATSFSATGIGAGTYYVRVRASTAGATGPASNEATLVVGSAGPCVPPDPPTGLRLLSASGGTVSLVWNPAGGSPSSYIVEAGSAPGLANLANSDLGLTTVLTATGVAPGTYYVRVRARNACGTSAPSNEVVVVVGAPPPATIPNVGGTWTLTRTGTWPWIASYSTFTVTLVQSGACLTGSILPLGRSISTPMVGGCLNKVSADGRVDFGSEHAYWNDSDDGYFHLTLDSTLNRMSGSCTNTFTCTSATAFRVR
jgi:predicted phage tail protein